MANSARERNRKERGSAQYEKMVSRYNKECGNIKVYTLDDDGNLVYKKTIEKTEIRSDGLSK